ncbi:MAG: MBL fold metallo-hydrolase [Bacteroidia bacterium]|nr:MBL fold metallo-hydrolase [Bacteroidia bacterium]
MSVKVQLEILYTGYCMAPEAIAIKSGKRKSIRFHANVALIQHPEHGYILFDTGYAPRFFEVTAKWPEKMQALSTPAVIEKEWSVISQLNKKGIKAKDISHLVISHYHADHISGLKDFPQSHCYSMKSGYDQMLRHKGFSGVRRGLIQKLMPKNLEQRISFFDKWEPEERSDEFDYHYDMFGDGSIKIVQLPGHARGQIGLLINEGNEQAVFLAADGFWLTNSLDQNVLPNSIVKLFFDDWKAYKESFQKIRSYRSEHPNTRIISCHCPRVFDETPQKAYD